MTISEIFNLNKLTALPNYKLKIDLAQFINITCNSTNK